MTAKTACSFRRRGGVLALFAVGVLSAAVPAGASANDLSDPPAALLIIDIQEFYFPGGALPLAGPEAAGANAARVLDRFRDGGLPVVHIGHDASSGKDFHPPVAPRDLSHGARIVAAADVHAATLATLQRTYARVMSTDGSLEAFGDS